MVLPRAKHDEIMKLTHLPFSDGKGPQEYTIESESPLKFNHFFFRTYAQPIHETSSEFFHNNFKVIYLTKSTDLGQR